MPKSLKILLIIALNTSLFAQKSSVDLIYDDLETDRIDSAGAVRLIDLWLRGKDMPTSYQSDEPVKCGTFAGARLESFRNRHPELQKSLQIVSQAFYDHTFNFKGQSKTFRIFYDTTGNNAVPAEDLNGNQLRDWIEETGKAFEKSYRLQVDTLGYREPLNFSRSPFYYPVEIIDLSSDYGYTESIDVVTSNPTTFTTRIIIDNDFVEGGYATHGYDALRVTAAHEFFHAVQFSYQWRETDSWYYETSATWMEDVAYDEVNDYYAYIPTLFNSPQSPMTSFGLAYAMCVWNHMVEKKYGRSVIRQSWESMPTTSALFSIDGAIKGASNSNLALNFADFGRWNYFTASRVDSIALYPEGLNYPRVLPVFASVLRDTAIARSLSPLATHYYEWVANDSTSCTVNFAPASQSSQFSFFTIEYNPVTGKKFVENHSSESQVVIDALAPGDSLIVIVSNIKVTTSTAPENYSMSIALTDDIVHEEFISDFYLYPNPYRPYEQGPTDDGSLKMKFRLFKATDLQLEIYSLAGKRIGKKNFGLVLPGSYDGLYDDRFRWNSKDDENRKGLGSGVYFYVLKGDGFKKSGKIAVVR